jgi:hypothetical protein
MKRHDLSAGYGAPQSGVGAGVIVSLGCGPAQPSLLKRPVGDIPQLKTIIRFFN